LLYITLFTGIFKEVNMTENQPQAKKNITGLYIVFGALAVIALGYFILTKVNADASNWAGAVAPILIVGGYIMVAIGILVGWDE
jgi:undecaprenyl pyrophosphate phosphatase UppP